MGVWIWNVLDNIIEEDTDELLKEQKSDGKYDIPKTELPLVETEYQKEKNESVLIIPYQIPGYISSIKSKKNKKEIN